MNDKKLSIGVEADDGALREKLSTMRTLLVDHDVRAAAIVQRVLFSLGFTQLQVVTSSASAMEAMRMQPFDLVLVEWNIRPPDGLALVKSIRAPHNDARIRRDIPIIMLTGRWERDNIRQARDAGVNEFLARPFAAKALADRIVQIIENPRPFIDCPAYVGPCRRRQGLPPLGVEDRRDRSVAPEVNMATEGMLSWIQAEILTLLRVYQALVNTPNDRGLQQELLMASQAVYTQAQLFDYALGEQVASMLVSYIQTHLPPTPNHLVVMGKHIDAIRVIFQEKTEKHGHAIAEELISSLTRLVAKLD